MRENTVSRGEIAGKTPVFHQPGKFAKIGG